MPRNNTENLAPGDVEASSGARGTRPVDLTSRPIAKETTATTKGHQRGNGEGSVRLRADGRWEAVLSLSDGKRKSYYAKTRRDVQQKLDAGRRALHDGLPIAPERQTVAQYLNDWLEAARPTVRPKTWETYELNVRRVLPHLGTRRLAALTPAHVQTCYTALLDRGLSRRSVRQAHEMLHRALRQAAEWGLCVRNAADLVHPPRPERKEMHTLAESQVCELFEATVNDPHHSLWVLLVTTGLRLGEAQGLTWSSIDLDAQTLVVRRALQRRRGGTLEFVEPKTGRSRRVVHLVGDTVTVLRAHWRAQAERRLALGPTWVDQDLVFTNSFGGPQSPDAVSHAWRSMSKRLGMDVRLHDLRHTAATLMLGWGQHPKIVQEMLGHSTITITLDTYSHVAPAIHREAVQQFARLFG